jgi:hypothetical protein
MNPRSSLARTVPAACLALAAMSSAAGASPPAETDGSIAVPFLFERGQVVVEVFLGESGPYRFLLDTGTSPSVIDLRTAQSLAIPLGEPSATGAGAGTGAMEVRRCLLPALTLGGITARGLEAAGVDLSALSSGFGRKIDGVLGYGFLQGRVLTIDYAKKALTFHPAQGPGRADLLRRGRGRRAVPFELYGDDHTPCARLLSIGGSPALRVTLDTGSSGFAAVYYETAVGLGWKKKVEAAPIRRGEGYRGSFPSAVMEARSVVFGGFDLGTSEISVPLPGSNYGEERGGIADGNVGNALLSRFRITLDYPGRVVLIETTGTAGVEK